ncbi:hypothetical protein [Spirosoma montaniterrae]|uniref:NIPSNAP domain-containing protein n=1 Tax=Spirosoma montaniterrae TaxID=1178516 RepID=A0A1P9WVA3_9BACT|nr:hypothetical protein [Spirosoma montaniterrae]AQG79317.1 hypothetical protein AWR27_08270 [Spirosoma montaniterrae]
MNKFTVFLVIVCLCSTVTLAQRSAPVAIVDFVKILNGRQQEAIFYYENNWKVYREVALEKGYIKGYKLMRTASDSTANFDLMLITEYTDSLQYNLSEERFQQIIKDRSPNGSKLLNDYKPGDFRKNLFFKKSRILLEGGLNRK